MCSCQQCEYFGGLVELFEIYPPDTFTNNLLRQIWAWLDIQLSKGRNEIWKHDTEDPTRPKLYHLARCISESMQFNQDNYLFLKDYLNETDGEIG